LACYKEAKEDLYIEDTDDNIRALSFLDDIENTGEIEIRGLFKIRDPLTTSSNNELSDLLIT
jgi:hypothetical protein